MGSEMCIRDSQTYMVNPFSGIPFFINVGAVAFTARVSHAIDKQVKICNNIEELALIRTQVVIPTVRSWPANGW